VDKNTVKNIISRQATMSEQFWHDFDKNIDFTITEAELVTSSLESNPLRGMTREILRQIKKILELRQDKEKFVTVKKDISKLMCQELVKEKRQISHQETLNKAFAYLKDFIIDFLQQPHDREFWTLQYFHTYIKQHFASHITTRINTIITNYCTGFTQENILSII